MASLNISVILRATDRITAPINKIADNATKQMSRLSQAFRNSGGALDKMASGFASERLVSFFADLATSTVETAAKFQKYDIVLTNALQSQEKAAEAMAMIKELAASTPFSVDELTSSYVKFVNRGLNPTKDELIAFGDIAASQGKSFDQFTEAVLDATSGEFERLKEFGIKANAIQGTNKARLSFKGLTLEVEKTPEALKAALIQFGKMDGVAGGMEAVSQSWEGMTSNFGDSMDAIKVAVGSVIIKVLQPLFALLLRAMGGLAEFFADAEHGALRVKLALVVLAPVIGTIFVAALISMATAIYTAVIPSLTLLGSVITAVGTAILATPVGWILAGIVAIVVVVALLIVYWDEIWATVTGFSGWWENAVPGWVKALFPWITLITMLVNHWETVKAVFLTVWGAIVSAITTAMPIIRAAIDFMFIQPFNLVRGLANAVLSSITSAMSGVISLISRVWDSIPAPLQAFIAGGTGAAAITEALRSGGVSPNTATSETRSTTENRSTVDVNFNGAPKGTQIKQNSKAPGINIRTAPAT